MPKSRLGRVAAVGILAGLAHVLAPAGSGRAQDAPRSGTILEGSVPRAPCDDRDELRRPFFGDLHVHTAFSLDASTMGTRNRPADAYRFARGDELGLQPYRPDGRPMRTARLARPLDFAAVTDHAELIGEWQICNTPGLPGHGSLMCRIYRRWPRVAFFWMNAQASRAVRHDFCGKGGQHCLDAAHTPWLEIRAAAEEAYDRSTACAFTTFNAYEWTGAAGLGNNFHRNVIFANDVVPELPISFIEKPDLLDFWQDLDDQCISRPGGCDVLVIPHNTNLSAGRMFAVERPDGSPIDRAEAEARRRMEMLVEVMQHKGDSECMLGYDTEDELCQFENLASNNFAGRFFGALAEPPTSRQFVRNILKEGLVQEARLGVNPFQLGLIASTDTHLGTPGLVAESASFPGHGGAGKPPGEDLPVGLPDTIDFNPGGLAVVWAEENSRHALFEAMKRREVYGTSGPRIVVRFFGGWEYETDLCQAADPARTGYAAGVAMGSDLPPPPPGVEPSPAPRFFVSALADPGVPGAPGTPLERVQIVKGWLADGTTHERVFDVATSAGPEGRVDPLTCETSGDGAGSLCRVWQDPEFDPAQPAFYYARVVESPTCRWSQRICIAAGIRCDDPSTMRSEFEPCCAPEHRPIIRERAWSSPIWYRPGG